MIAVLIGSICLKIYISETVKFLNCRGLFRKSFTMIENRRSRSDSFYAKYLNSFANTESIVAGLPVISTLYPPAAKLLVIPMIFYSTKVAFPMIDIDIETV